MLRRRFYPPGRLNYWKSSFLTGLGDEAIDTMLAHCADRPPRSVTWRSSTWAGR